MVELNKIYNEDCLEGMKRIEDNSIDLILTDPPYNIARENNFATMGRSSIDFGEWDKGFDQLVWLNEIPRILSQNGSAVIFNDWKNIGEIAKYCESIGLVIKDMLRWEKTNPMPRNRDRRYITDYECAIWLTNKKLGGLSIEYQTHIKDLNSFTVWLEVKKRPDTPRRNH